MIMIDNVFVINVIHSLLFLIYLSFIAYYLVTIYYFITYLSSLSKLFLKVSIWDKYMKGSGSAHAAILMHTTEIIATKYLSDSWCKC